MRSFVVVLLFCSGCIAGAVKGKVGVASDGVSTGLQVGASFGFGYAGKRSALVESIGVAAGMAPKVGLDVGLDYVRLPDTYSDVPMGWRVGMGGIPLAYGDPAIVGGRAALLWVVRDKTRSSGHEKFGSSSTRNLGAAGLEVLIGASIYDENNRAGGSVSLTYEHYMLSRGF